MSVTLRDYRSKDFIELWRLDQECFPPGISYSRGELMHYMTRRGAFTLVAEQGPRIVGFLVAQHDGRGLGHIITIDVRQNSRRSGIGDSLMQAAEERLRASGCKGIYLETAVDNDGAIAFYKRRGYLALKTIPRYYHGQLDALLMGKKFVRQPDAATE